MVNFDDIVSVLYNTVLNPKLTIPTLLGYVLKNPETLEILLRGEESNYLPLITASPIVQKALYAVLGGLAIRFQNYLSRRALNNGVWDTYDWSKEIVVVTGGAGGIGGEIVKQLAAKGTRVAVLDVLPLSYTKPDNVEYYKCDLTDTDSLHASAEKIRAKWGDPTLLCAIAGIVRAKPLLELSKRDLDLTFGVNTIGLVMCYKEFVPAMVKTNHGHVLTMASATAYVSACQMVDYAASKAAALTLHEGLQSELKHVYKAPKVRCTVLCPATVGTKMFTGLHTPFQFMMPILKPEEVAAAAVGALDAGESRHIDMPFMAKFAAFVRPLPSHVRVGAQDSGAGSMASFGGHKVMD